MVQKVDRVARASGRRRSDVLRDATSAYVEVVVSGSADAPAERVRALIGSVHTGTPGLADRHSEYVKRILRRGR
ncbi:MAG: hypothetical protein IT293_16210 [Deltaproteobacteria bacterium]|nr:hypothetical protein [Deltaproteobacteria bacterium]